jgi:Icc protein
MKLSCLSLLQVTDIHVLPTFENTLLGVQTERYFHDVLAHAFEKRKNYDLLLLTGDLAQSPSKHFKFPCVVWQEIMIILT